MEVQRLSHIGLCVADLERSKRFYCDGLGFRPRHALSTRGPHVDRLLGLETADLEAVYLERDGVRLELLFYPKLGAHEGESPSPMNRAGFTHWSLRVADLSGAVERLAGLGATVLESTRVQDPRSGAGAIFVLDPDGTRIELFQAEGDPEKLPGEA